MAELQPLGAAQGAAPKPTTATAATPQQPAATQPKPAEQPTEKPVDFSGELLKKVNGELCFELKFDNGSIIVSMSKLERHIPEFKKMTIEQKETFIEQAAIFGANPLMQEIYPLPFEKPDGSISYAPVTSAKKYVEKGMENPKFNGMKSGVVIEKEDGSIEYRKGQVFTKAEKLLGGWCEVFIKGLREPIFKSVNINEVMNFKRDGTPNKFWKDKPALMVEKVAQKQTFEIAMKLPKIYIPEELPFVDINHEDVTNQSVIPASNEEFFK